MANISAYNIAIAPQNLGKISPNPGSANIKSGGGNTVSFLEILQQSMANIRTTAEQQGTELIIQEEDIAMTEPAASAASLKMLEMFGLPQDTAQQIHDYFAPDFDGSAKIISYAEAGEFIEDTIQDERISEDIRQIFSDIALKLKSGYESGIRELFETALTNLYEQIGVSQTAHIAESGYNISDQLASQTGRADPLMKERAELMTKAIEKFDAANKSEAVSAGKTNSTMIQISQSIKQMTITETTVTATPAAMTVEEMFNVMRTGKVTSELLNANLNLTESAVSALGTEAKAATNAAPELNILQLVTETQNNPSNIPVTATMADAPELQNTANTAELANETKGSDILKVKEPESGKPAVNDAQESKIAAGLNKPQEIAGEFIKMQAQAVQNQGQTADTDIAQSAKEISRIISENMTMKSGESVSQGEFEIKMKLSPKELGELFVKVSYKDGNVVLDITAANKAAESGILSRISDLRESLAVRGVTLENVEVNSGNLDHGGQSNNSHNAQRSGYNNNRNGGNFGFNNSGPIEIEVSQETARREMIMNHMKSRRLLYKTI